MYHWSPASEAQKHLWSSNLDVIKTRNTITKWKRMLALAPSGPPLGTLPMKPIRIKIAKKRNKETLAPVSPIPLLPKAGMNTLGKEIRMLRMSSPQTARKTPQPCPVLSIFYCSISKIMLLGFYKMHMGFPKRVLETDKSDKC